MIDRFISYLKNEKRYSQHTYNSYARDLTMFANFKNEFYPEAEFAELELKNIRSYVVWMKSDKKYSNASIKRACSALNSLFKFLQRTGEVKTNPCTKLTLAKLPSRVPKFLTPKQIEELLDAENYTDDYTGKLERCVIEMLIMTGMRRAELLGLREGDVDFSALQIKVRGKGGKERLIPISQGYAEALQEYLGIKEEITEAVASDALFVTTKGKALNESALYSLVRNHMNRCTTLLQKSPHVLRHSFATLLSNNGADLNVVKELLGHSSLASTQVYTHSSIEQLKNVYQKAHPRGKKG